MVLVNDFGALGLDGALLEGRGADVVELSNGCICCSLRSDLAAQLKEVVAKMKPDRVLIEPSGVADVAALLRALHTPEIAPLIRARRLYTVIDAKAFLSDFARMPDYFDVQTRLAPVFILNKTDLVSAGERAMVMETLRAQNPDALVVPARYGVPIEGAVGRPRPGGSGRGTGRGARGRDGPGAGPRGGGARAGVLEHAAFGRTRPRCLGEALAAMASGRFGQVLRVKGIAPAGSGWVKFDLAGGRPSVSAHVPRGDEAPRALAIGHDLDRDGLPRLFAACAPGADREILSPTPVAPARRSVGIRGLADAAPHPLGCGCLEHAPGMACSGVEAGAVAA